MDILVPDSWLRDYLETEATPMEIAKYVSLCGPSIERISKIDKDFVYHIEVTTNRMDTASVLGIAREAAAILPRFGIKAKLNDHTSEYKSKVDFKKSAPYLNAIVDPLLCPRFTAILIKDVVIGESPDWLKDRLAKVGVRPINNVVDISNYIMHAIGQPVHTFDYDKIAGHKMILRASKKGEKITTLDSKTHVLPGGDIVIEDADKKLIDLAGIMGGANSAVDEHTKNVLLFVQTYSASNIRKTSMALAHRTEAAQLFEKGIDPELVDPAIKFGVDLFTSLCKANTETVAINLYPKPYANKKISVKSELINSLLGITLTTREMSEILISLGFGVQVTPNQLTVSIPSWRSNDILIWQDIAEEIARLYGYHNMPSVLMTGKIPNQLENSPFAFENSIKNILKGWGGLEVYTLSLVAKDQADIGALKLKNPLGEDAQYLRTTLTPSLIAAAQQNIGKKEAFHLFEITNVYIPVKGDLPREEMKLAGIISGDNYRNAKGIPDSLLSALHIDFEVSPTSKEEYLPNKCINYAVNGKQFGTFGQLTVGDYFYYEFDMLQLQKLSKPLSTYTPISKYPPQIEDITLNIPERVYIKDILSMILDQKELYIQNCELVDTFERAFTFRIWYQHSEHTLSDKEVESSRKALLAKLSTKFSVKLKA